MGSGSMGYLTQIWHTINNAKTVKFADTKSRTRDLLITNQLLYQLSYAGVDAIIKTEWLRSKPRSTAGQKSNVT